MGGDLSSVNRQYVNPVYPRPKGPGFSLSLDLKLPSFPV
jgi:hypothetical protein